MLPSMSASVGLGFPFNKEIACMICPDWQYPHCGTLNSIHFCCTGCSPFLEIASMVVISAPPTLLMLVTHDRIALPSRCTVQVPHSAMPQPNFVPVSPSTSRKYHSSGRSGSPSKERSTPFTFRGIIFAPRFPIFAIILTETWLQVQSAVLHSAVLHP